MAWRVHSGNQNREGAVATLLIIFSEGLEASFVKWGAEDVLKQTLICFYINGATEKN